jgi:hypothetical protein
MRLSHAGTVQVPLRKSNFCGERKPDDHGAQGALSRRPRRDRAAWRGGRDRNYAQPAENLGPIWVLSPTFVAAIGAAGSPVSLRLGSFLSPSSVDTPELFAYRKARPSCIASPEPVEPRERVGRRSKYGNILLRIQSSVVNLGGTAVG